MDIKLKGRELNKEKTIALWKSWYKQHTDENKSIALIASENINPLTKKPYTIHAIYYAFYQLKKL